MKHLELVGQLEAQRATFKTELEDAADYDVKGRVVEKFRHD